VPGHEQQVKRGPLALRQLAKRQVPGLGSGRQPLGNRVFAWDKHDQGEPGSVNADCGGRCLVILESFGQGRQYSVRVIAGQPQVGLQLLDPAAWTFGEHADRAHTDHDLAGWVDDADNFDPAPGEADVSTLHPPVSPRVPERTAG
jgi:hypothetical protein